MPLCQEDSWKALEELLNIILLSRTLHISLSLFFVNQGIENPDYFILFHNNSLINKKQKQIDNQLLPWQWLCSDVNCWLISFEVCIISVINWKWGTMLYVEDVLKMLLRSGGLWGWVHWTPFNGVILALTLWGYAVLKLDSDCWNKM